MQGHFGVQAIDPPTRCTQPHAKLWLFAGDQVVAEPSHRNERVDSHHCVTAACARLPNLYVPLLVAQPVVNRPLRISFAPTPERCGNVAVGVEKGQGSLGPRIYQFTIAIDELDKRKMRGHLPQTEEASVAGTSSREWNTRVKIENFQALVAGPFR
jgi:hypothetical protein